MQNRPSTDRTITFSGLDEEVLLRCETRMLDYRVRFFCNGVLRFLGGIRTTNDATTFDILATRHSKRR